MEQKRNSRNGHKMYRYLMNNLMGECFELNLISWFLLDFNFSCNVARHFFAFTGIQNIYNGYVVYYYLWC